MQVRAGLVLAAVVLSAAATVQADEQAELKALVDKAIKATGGEEKLKKLDGFTLKARGTFHMDNQEATFTAEGPAKALDRWRLDFDANVGGNALKVVLVFNADKAWAKVNERTEDAPAEIVGALQADTYALRLAQTLLPLKDAACKLAPMGEVAVGGRPAVGVKAAAKDRPEVNLFFDKETGLLVRMDLQVKDMPGMPEVTHEFLFNEPKELSGLKHFSKMVLNRDGKKLMEVELTELNAADKLDASLFEKP